MWILSFHCFLESREFQKFNKVPANVIINVKKEREGTLSKVDILDVFSLYRVNDHVSEYERMECMTRCAAVAISFPILNITHMHKYSWQDFSGISAAWNAHFPILF